MLEFAVMPSMRFLWSAGPAAARDNTVIYNCSFAKLNFCRCVCRMFTYLMCGTGLVFLCRKRRSRKITRNTKD